MNERWGEEGREGLSVAVCMLKALVRTWGVLLVPAGVTLSFVSGQRAGTDSPPLCWGINVSRAVSSL